MTTKEFKKIAGYLKKAYQELEEKVDVLSPEYEIIQEKIREKVLDKAGFTLEEYREAKEEYLKSRKKETPLLDKVLNDGTLQLLDEQEQQINETKNRLNEIDKKHSERHIPTKEEIAEIAEEVAEVIAKKYIVPPIIKHEIVKETTIEQPKIIETTRVIKEEYNDKPLKEKLEKIETQIKENKDELQKQIVKEINMFDMPDFRKLAMGLQQQIDDIDTSGGGAVDSVNGQTGTVVLDADDIDDTSTTNKFVTAGDITNLGNLSGTNTGDQVGDGVTITGAGTVGDPFVSSGGGLSESLAIAFAVAL